MSEGSISQEEIDALLSGVDMGGLPSAGASSAGGSSSIDAATLQKFAEGLKDKLSARGGGSSDMVQGNVKASREEIVKALGIEE